MLTQYKAVGYNETIMADEGQIQEIKRNYNYDTKNLIRGEGKPVVTQLSCKY